MSNSSFDGFDSPWHSSSSLESASGDHTPSPPQSSMHPPLPFPIHPLPPQVFILEEVAPFDQSGGEKENSKELRLRAKEKAEEAATAAFLNAPTRRRRRQRFGQSSSESSALGLSTSNEADSSDNSSDGSDLGDDEGEEEEEEEEDDDDEEEREYLALDYP